MKRSIDEILESRYIVTPLGDEETRVLDALRDVRELLERVWPIVEHEFGVHIAETEELEEMIVRLGGKLHIGRPPPR